MRRCEAIGPALMVLGAVACSHGPQVISEKRMMDPAEVASIADKQVKTTLSLSPRVMKVAIIGVNSPRTVIAHHRGHHSRWDPSAGTREGIQTGVEMSQDINDVSKLIACRALDSSFDSLLAALTAVGLQAVPVSDQLGTSALGRRAENSGGSLACVASKARVSILSLGGTAVASIFAHRDWLSGYQQDIGDFISATGVDGVLMAYLSAAEMGSEGASLILFVKQPDGVVRAGWQGHVQENRIRFEPVVSTPNTDDERIQNIGRVYHHTFQLLAAKLAADSRK